MIELLVLLMSLSLPRAAVAGGWHADQNPHRHAAKFAAEGRHVVCVYPSTIGSEPDAPGAIEGFPMCPINSVLRWREPSAHRTRPSRRVDAQRI